MSSTHLHLTRTPVLAMIKSLRRALLLSILPAAQLTAQNPVGYGAESGAAELRRESAAAAVPTAASAEEHSRFLSREAHVAGTPAQARTRDYVIQQMKSWGIATEVREYEVWMPHPTSAHVWRLDPQPRELPLQEPPLAADPSSASRTPYPTVNGYSGSGDVSAEVVFVNYGLIEDYATLDSLGVDVKGKIAIARYGRSFRGIKAREAERHGAAALLIYSDPQNDGYVVGDVYPEGPMRPPRGVQRGSVMNTIGDPSTPGWPSTDGARRIPVAEMDVPRIPVIPLGYANAAELLRDLRGTDIPRGWQGGLPFRYHIGPGPVRARVAVANDTATRPLKTIWNTLGTIRGTEFPDEIVVIGGHRDAWGPGAADNVSGSVSVLEAAHAVAQLARQGQRPRRTIVFATWDAEEWGLIGSTEFVEEDSLRLLRGAVAYLNQDGAADGPNFGAGGSPSLRSVLRDIVQEIPSPDGGGSIYEVWRRAASVPDSLEPRMGDPGGGSDFAGFYNHFGIPHLDWGFGGQGGVYHSRYDSFHWMKTFGDTGFTHHAAAARIGAALALRLANADILPYDYVEFARTMLGYLPALDSAVKAHGWSADASQLRSAIGRMQTAALAFNAARDSALRGKVSKAVLARTNAALLRVERAMTRPGGLRSRPWYRNLIYASDIDNGYSNMVFPSVNEAVRAGEAGLASTEISDLAAHFDAAAAALDDAREALESGGR